MAELILTEEEKKINCFMEFDDGTLGKICKYALAAIPEIADEQMKSFIVASALTLIAHAIDNNSNKFSIKTKGVLDDNVNIGDWEVSVVRKEYVE